MSDEEARCTRDNPDHVRVMTRPCGFCGRSEPHEHSLAEFESAYAERLTRPTLRHKHTPGALPPPPL
jgi:hypothetical protein